MYWLAEELVVCATWIEVVTSSEMFSLSSLSPVCKHWNVSGHDYSFIGDGLDGPAIESRWGLRFSSPVQTGPRTHPNSYTIGTGSLFRGVKRSERVAYHQPSLSLRLKKEYSYTSTPLWAFSCCRVIFTLMCYLTWRNGD